MAFNEVVQHELSVKPKLGIMLAKLRDSYLNLFEQLINKLVNIQLDFQATTTRIARERDNSVLELTGRLKEMHERLRLVSHASYIKSNVLAMSQSNTLQLENEIQDMRQLVTSNLTQTSALSTPPTQAGLEETNPDTRQSDIQALTREQQRLSHDLDQVVALMDDEREEGAARLIQLDHLLDDTGQTLCMRGFACITDCVPAI